MAIADALAPWLGLLPAVGKLYRPLDDEGDCCVDADGVLWFHWTRAADPSQWPRQLELLELLARLVDADRKVFEALLSSTHDAYSHFFVAHRVRYETPYSLGVYVKLEDDGDHTRVLEQLTTPLDMDPHSAFQKAVRALDTRPVNKLIPVFVEVLSSAESPGTMETTLEFVYEQLQTPDCTGLFRVTVVDASPDTGAAVSHEALETLGRLADLGVRIPRVAIETSATVSVPPRTIIGFMTAIQSLLGVRGMANKSAPRLQHLQLRPPFSMHVVIALCSAIAQSETLQRLSVDAPLNDNHHRQPFPMEPFWRWLAYALFSRGASNRVAMFEIDASLLLRFYVQGMHSVAHHDDALVSELDPRLPIPSPWKNHVVDIPRGTETTLVYDYGGGKDVVATFTPTTPLQSLRVLQDDGHNGWLYVVLPGWGEARVARDCVTPRAVHSSLEPNSNGVASPRGVKHLRLNYATAGTLAAIESFLELAGTHVRRLDLHEPESHNHNGNIATVLLGDALRLCANLQEIDVFATEIDSFDLLTAANGPRIQRIKLRQLIVTSMRSVHRFFDALGDPSHALARNLRALSFHIFEQTIEDPTRGSIFNSCVRMLQHNTMLRECLAITLSTQRAAKFHDMFAAFDGQPLPARKAPLALASKLAFLSVLTQTTASAMHAVDVDLVGNIFQLAAQTHVRASSVEVAVTYEHSTR